MYNRGGHTDVVMALLEAGAQVSLIKAKKGLQKLLSRLKKLQQKCIDISNVKHNLCVNHIRNSKNFRSKGYNMFLCFNLRFQIKMIYGFLYPAYHAFCPS